MLNYMIRHKKWYSLTMTLIMLITMIIPNALVQKANAASEVVAGWTFSASNVDTATDGPSNKDIAKLILSNSRAATYSTAGNTIYKDGWASPAGGYWQAQFSTVGYSGLTLSSKQYGTGGGPRDFQIQYSIDGTNFVPFSDVYALTTTIAQKDINLPSEVNNQANVYIRWVNTSNASISATNSGANGTGTITQLNGNSRISDIVINGTSMSGPVAVSGVTLNTNTVNMTVGDAVYGLVATVSPANATNKAVNWTTDNAVVATVNSSGGVKAISAGTAKITATTVDGSFKATSNVTVLPGTGVQKTASPDGNKITFPDLLTVKGEPGTVGASVQMAVYFADNSIAGSAKASSDGSFNISITNPQSKTTVYVTAQESGKTISDKVAVNLAASTAEFKPGDVVFSQLYINGGNSGAFYNTKFFELYNTTNNDINFNNQWAIIYTSATGTSFGAGTKLSGTIKAHGYYLVAGSTGATGASLPVTPDLTTTLNPSGSTGGILTLANSITGLSNQDDPKAIDIVTFGNGTSTSFTTKTDHWGAPFFNTGVGGGTLLRKTDASSDPRVALGLGNGFFSKDPSKDFVLNSPTTPSNPEEVIIRSSKSMLSPDASKISFTSTGGNAIATGAAGSVPAASSVKAYVVNGGSVSAVGQAATAAADGSFTLSFSDSNNNQSVYLTFTDSTQPKPKESVYAHVDAAANPNAIVPINQLRKNDANGLPLNIGYATTIEGVVTSDNKALGPEKTNFYVQDATGGIEVISGQNQAVTFGHKVKIAGKIAFTAGRTQFVPTLITDEGTDTLPAASTNTLDKFNTYATAELLEGKLVSVRGKVSNIPAAGPDYNVTIIDDSGNTVIVKILATSGIDINSAIALGDTLTFTGIVGQSKLVSPYTGGYYVLPRKASDIKGDLQFNHIPLTKYYIGLSVPIKATAKYADSITLYYKRPGDSTYSSIPMLTAANDNVNYNAKIPASTTSGKLSYYIVAQGNGQTLTSGDVNNPNLVDITEDTDGPAYSNELPAMNDSIESPHPVISITLDDPSGVDVNSLKISVDGRDFSAQAEKSASQIKLTLTSNDDLAVGTHTVQVSAKDLSSRANLSTYSWSFQVVARFTGGNHYRGTTHNHTSISHDASGAPELALKAAQAHGYDYFAFSDHSHDIDATNVGKDTVDHKGMPERTGGSDWQLTKDLAKKYTKDGSFVVFPGFEMTSTTWGHSNVFGTDNFIDRVVDGGKYQNLQNYYNWTLTYDNIVAQFNHPAMSANAFDNFIPFDKNVNKLFTMLEVGNGSGQYAYVNAENKFFSALDLGWHVAPTYGEDNHNGTWGETKKRTVIVANDLSTDSLIDAMRKMHVYFSEDPNFQLDVLANGYYMGATVDSKVLNFNVTGSDKSPTDPKYITVPASDNPNIAKVELVTNGGRVIDSYTPSGNATAFNWKPNVNVVGGQQWFVIRVTQKDGDKIYSSPIWSPADPLSVKVNDLTIVEGAAVAGIPINLKAGIANLGTINLTNLIAHFYYDSIDSAHLIGDATIASLASNKNVDASVLWSNPVAGNHKLIVVLQAGDGNDLGVNNYEQAITVKPPLGIKVLIDATHNNENTTSDTGTYADNLKTFTLSLKQQGYTVVENKTALTDQLLSDVKVLMMTHPSTAYSASEIAVIKSFVNRGGSLLLSEKSNFGGSNQNLNSLLSGVGSSILVNNDGVFDETTSGNFWSTPLTSNFSVRLHLTPVRNRLTDFVSLLDFYSGSSLAKNDGAGNKVPLTNSDTVTILARGNESTFQDSPQIKADAVKYNVQTANGKSGPALTDVTGGSVIPLVASEQIGSGRIFVAGMNVFNDKQMTQNDGPTNNVPFGLNVVNWLSNIEQKVIPIAEARKLPDGTTAVVEGKVTAQAGIFYDAAYIQDDTGGIMAFNEVPKDSLQLGDTIRIYGYIGTFDNDKEIMFNGFDKSIVKVSSGPPVPPKFVKTGESISDQYQGQLVQVKGKVTAIPDNYSYVINDGSGDVLVFVDGYVLQETGVAIPKLSIGDTLLATGLSSKYANGDRIRVRDTRELMNATEGVPVTGVTLNSNAVNLLVYGVYGLTATIAPANATNQTVTWTSSNTSVATVDANGKVTALSPGTATITVSTLDGSFTATSSVTVTRMSSGGSSGNSTGSSTGSGTGTGNTDTSGTTKDGDHSFTIPSDKLPVNGKAIEIPANTWEVKIPSNTADLIKQNNLEIKSDKIALSIPSDLIKQLASKLPASELKDSAISLTLSPLSSAEAKNIVDKGRNESNSSIKLSGEVYELHLSITSADGKTADLSTFDKPITIQLKVDPTVNPKLAGVYYISDSGKLEYVGGKYVDGYMLAEISHFSKYAVLEVTKTFADISNEHWAANVIKELAAKQIVSGTSVTTFEPERSVTRAEFTAMLVRALNLTAKGDMTFTDVKSSDWYADSISIAVKAGIVQGKSASQFDANAQITREEMVTMLIRAYENLKGKASAKASAAFADESQVSAWAAESVKTAAGLNLIQGREAGKFDPKGITTRAESAQVIYNLLTK